MNTKQLLTALNDEIKKLTHVRSLLTGSDDKPARKRRPMSAAARERIAEAQRKRWAKTKIAKKGPR